ncbi:immunoglobulin domain-containing protein [Vibrio parahaemolyticus]
MAIYFNGTEIGTLNLDGVNIDEVYLDGQKVARKPMITTQPVGGTITDSQNLTLSVVADGLGSTLSYQWYNGSTPISDATGSSYVFTPSSTGNHTFFCRVFGFGGYTDTSTVTVVVEPSIVAPTITTSPSSGTITEAQDYTASIVVDWGGETGTIVWLLDNVAQPSSNSTTYTFVDPSLGTHTIRAEATNSKGTDVSSDATLTVNQVISTLTVADKGVSKPTIRGYQLDAFGSLTNPEYTIRPPVGKLHDIIARDGLIDGASGAHIMDIKFSADTMDYRTFVVKMGGLSVTFTYNEDSWFINPEVDPDGKYRYTALLLDEFVVGDVRTLWDLIWNGVGNDYSFEIDIS